MDEWTGEFIECGADDTDVNGGEIKETVQ